MADDLRDQLREAIGPTMRIGLQDAELHDEPGAQRIEEWITWISDAANGVVGPELERLRKELAEANERAERMTDLSAKYYAERNEALDGAEQAEADLAKALSGIPLICCDERHKAKVRGLEAENHYRLRRDEYLTAAIERAREVARHPRTSQGRVKDYVDASDVLAALDPPKETTDGA